MSETFWATRRTISFRRFPRNVRLSEAPSFGKPVSAYDALSRGAEAYDALAQELLEHNQYAVTRVERKD